MTARSGGAELHEAGPCKTERPDGTGAPATLGVAHRDDIDLWYDVHGSGDTTVLLLAGAACQATQWEPAFFEPLIELGHRVIRFDWRDTGLSTWADFRDRPYTVDDLVDDAIAVLDDAEIAAAHLVGFSMGGLIAQGAAVHHPERVRSLTLLASGYYGGMLFEDTDQSRALAAFFGRPRPGPDELEDWLVEQWRTLAGSRFEFVDDDWQRRARDGWRGGTTHGAHISRSRVTSKVSMIPASAQSGEQNSCARFVTQRWWCMATMTGCSLRATARRSPRPSPVLDGLWSQAAGMTCSVIRQVRSSH